MVFGGGNKGRIRKFRQYVRKSLSRFADRMVKSYRYGVGPFERGKGRSQLREKEMRERRRFHLQKRIYYEQLLAEQGGALGIYSGFAERDRKLYRALYGEDPDTAKSE